MRYILITLLSFTFATQITTREFEVECDGCTIDFSEISGLDYGSIQIAGFNSDSQYCYLTLGSGTESQIDCSLENGIYYCQDYAAIPVGLYFTDTQEFSVGANCEFTSETPIIKFWITGAFEDEDTSMGDMNNDGSLNIFDVLELVNIILDGDSGDIFDVMEIIKRV